MISVLLVFHMSVMILSLGRLVAFSGTHALVNQTGASTSTSFFFKSYFS